LLRVLEMILLKVRGQGLHLDFVRHGRRISLSPPTFLAGIQAQRQAPLPFGLFSLFSVVALVEQIFSPRGEFIVEILG
jgi:hypothetical protein